MKELKVSREDWTLFAFGNMFYKWESHAQYMPPTSTANQGMKEILEYEATEVE